MVQYDSKIWETWFAICFFQWQYNRLFLIKTPSRIHINIHQTQSSSPPLLYIIKFKKTKQNYWSYVKLKFPVQNQTETSILLHIRAVLNFSKYVVFQVFSFFLITKLSWDNKEWNFGNYYNWSKLYNESQ